MGKITFVLGFSAGYVAGAAAGRERYEQIQSTAQSAYTNPAVQQYTSKAQTQAQSLITMAKSKLGGQGGSRRSTSPSTYDVVEIPGNAGGAAGTTPAPTITSAPGPASVGTTTTSSTYSTGTTGGLGTTGGTTGSLDPVTSEPIDLGPDGTTGTSRPTTGL